MNLERLNRRFLLRVALAVVLLVTCYVVVHAVQLRRQTSALLTEASQAEEQGRPERAERFLRLYLNLDPQSEDALARYGLLLEKRPVASRPRRKIVDLYEQVLVRNGERHDIRRRLVALAIEAGSFDVALTHLAALGTNFPNDAKVAYQTGLCREAKREYALAATAYTLAAGLPPQPIEDSQPLADSSRSESSTGSTKTTSIESSQRLADIYRRHLDNPQQADQVIDDMVKANPKESRAYLLRAAYRRQFGRSTPEELKAIREDVEAAQSHAPPGDIEVILAGAEVAASDKKFDEARTLLERGLKEHPQEARLHLALVGIDLRTGRATEAQADLRRGLEASPSDGKLLWLSAQLFIDEGKWDEAQERIAKLKKTRQPPGRIEFLEARIQVAQRHWRTAATNLERIRSLMADAPDLALQGDILLGQCYDQLDEPDRQLTVYRRVTATYPLHPAARQGSVAALAKLGRLEEAVTEAQTLTQLPQPPATAWLAFARVRLLQTLRTPAAQRKWAEVEALLDKAAKTAAQRAAAPPTGKGGAAPEPGGPVREAPALVALPQEAQVALLRAEVLAAQGRLDKARQLLEEVRAKNPRQLEPWLALARLDGYEGRSDEALRLLANAQQQVGDRVELRLARLPFLPGRKAADLALALGQLGDHLEHFGPEERVRLLRALGDVYEQVGEPAEAERLGLQGVREQPDDLGLWTQLFEAALRTGTEDTRRERLAQIQRIEGEGGPVGRYGEACCLLASAQSGDRSLLPKARNLLMLVAGQRPAWPIVSLRLAEVADLDGQDDQAIEHYRRALDLGERRGPVVHRLMQLLYQHQRYDQAEEVVRKLQDVPPLTNFLQKASAEIALRKFEPDRALEWARQAAPVSSANFRDHLWLGQVFWAAKRETEAEAAFRRAVRLAEKESEPWLVLIQLQVRRGNKAEAEKTLREAQAKMDPAQATLALATGQEILGHTDRAAEYLRQALAAKPDAPALLQLVSQFYLRNSQPREALPLLRKLLEPRLGTPAGVAAWARRSLAMLLGSPGSGPVPLREALSLLDENQRQNGESPEDQRARAGVLATRPGRRPEAIRILEGLRQKSALTRVDELRLAGLYMAENKWQEANEALERLVATDATDPQVVGAYVHCLLRRGAALSTPSWLAKLEQLAPNRPETVELRARQLFAAGQEADALALLQKYVADPAVKPEESVQRLRQAGALLEEWTREGQGLHPECARVAEEMYRQYVARSGKPESLLVLASYLVRQERVSEALDVCEQALKTAPEEVVTWVAATVLDSVQATDDQMRRVERWLMAALDKKPGTPIFLDRLAGLRERQTRFSEAEALFRQALARDPRHVVALNNLAYLLALQGEKGAEALELSQKAIEIGGVAAPLLDTRAVAYLAVRQPEAAIADLEEAIADMPSATLYLHLARAYLEAGRADAAATAWKKANDAGLRPAQLHPLDRENVSKLKNALARR
jgi:tetratricopeptide (TPR) repeat protein